MSVREAAVQVLRDANQPLTSQQITDRILKQGLWQTQGKTPHASYKLDQLLRTDYPLTTDPRDLVAEARIIMMKLAPVGLQEQASLALAWATACFAPIENHLARKC